MADITEAETPEPSEVCDQTYYQSLQWETWKWVADHWLRNRMGDCDLFTSADISLHFARIMEWIDPINHPHLNNGHQHPNSGQPSKE